MFYKPCKIPGLTTRINSVRSILFILMAIGSITPCIADCNTTQWWTDPCNQHPLLPSQMDNIRHGRSVNKHRGPVIEQLKRSIIQSRILLKEIELIYTNETVSVKPRRENFKWLNTRQMIRSIGSPKKFEKKLRKLNPNLQRLAGALEVLSCASIQSPGHFDRAKRDKIIHDAKINLRAFICEVNEAIKPNIFRRKISLEKMKIKLPSQMDMKSSYFYDVQILNNVKWFLTQLKRKALRRPLNQVSRISKL